VSDAWNFCPRCAARLKSSDEGGLPRLSCSAGCGFVHWDNPAPVLAALVEYQGAIVLARNRAWAAGAFGLITGFSSAAKTRWSVSRARSGKNSAWRRRRRR
jgi:NTP pyrophosphohydrolases containing a Zn-finger, probably nucleic-acid-binding